MLKLWGRRTSINVQKVLWVLAESGLEASREDVGGSFGGLDTDGYAAMNPTRRVPTLRDGDLVLWESNAICRYLVDRHGGPLRQQGPAARAQADMWMEWFQNAVYAPFITTFHQTVRLPPADRNPDMLAAALDDLHDRFGIFEAALGGNDFILGDRLCLGDIPFGSCLYRYFTLDIPRRSFPRIEAYYDRLVQNPVYREAVMVDYSSLRAP